MLVSHSSHSGRVVWRLPDCSKSPGEIPLVGLISRYNVSKPPGPNRMPLPVKHALIQVVLVGEDEALSAQSLRDVSGPDNGI